MRGDTLILPNMCCAFVERGEEGLREGEKKRERPRQEQRVKHALFCSEGLVSQTESLSSFLSRRPFSDHLP